MRYLIILLFIFMISCEKNIIDYRNKYIGEYQFNVHYSSWDLLNGDFDTTYSNLGRIDCGADKKSILIYISDTSTPISAEIFEDGSIEGIYIGEFESTHKLNMHYSSRSPGSSILEVVIGDKKE